MAIILDKEHAYFGNALLDAFDDLAGLIVQLVVGDRQGAQGVGRGGFCEAARSTEMRGAENLNLQTFRVSTCARGNEREHLQ